MQSGSPVGPGVATVQTPIPRRRSARAVVSPPDEAASFAKALLVRAYRARTLSPSSCCTHTCLLYRRTSLESCYAARPSAARNMIKAQHGYSMVCSLGTLLTYRWATTGQTYETEPRGWSLQYAWTWRERDGFKARAREIAI